MDSRQVFTLVVQILVLVLLPVNIRFNVVRIRRLREAGRSVPRLLKASVVLFVFAIMMDVFVLVLTLTGN